MADWSRYRKLPSAPDVAVGLAVLLGAAVLAWQTVQIPASPLYARVGPSVFPWVVVGLLSVLGALLTAHGLRGGWSQDETHGDFDPPGILYVVLGLVLNLVLIGFLTAFGLPENAGFILASTVMFVCVARAFGSRQVVRDVAIGFTVAAIAFFAFDEVLSYRVGNAVDAWLVGPARLVLETLAPPIAALPTRVGLRPISLDLVRFLLVLVQGSALIAAIALALRARR